METLNDILPEPNVYFCIQHRLLGRLPVLRNMPMFYIHLAKPLRDFDPIGDTAILQEFLESWWVRLNYRVDIFRDRWPEEYTVTGP